MPGLQFGKGQLVQSQLSTPEPQAITPLPTRPYSAYPPINPILNPPHAGSGFPQPGIHSSTLQPPTDSGCPNPAPHPAASQKGYFGPGWRGAHPASSCPGQDGGTSWLCRAARGKLPALMLVLPGLLAGLWAQPHAGPGHLVVGRGSAEVCVAPTHARLSHHHQGPSPRHRARSGTAGGDAGLARQGIPGQPCLHHGQGSAGEEEKGAGGGGKQVQQEDVRP